MSSSSSSSSSFSSSSRKHSGRIALITGATRGIGYAIAERLGLDGATVVICSRGEKNVKEAAEALKKQGIDVHGVVCHVGTAEQRSRLIRSTVEKYGRIDILVSNVAVNPAFGSMLDTTDEKTWDKIFDVNVKSHFFLIKEAVPHMTQPGSNIIIVSSYAGYNSSQFLGAYSVSKTALISLTKVLSKEVAPKGIRINCIAPGVIKTKFSSALWKDEGVAEHNLKDIPLHRFGESSEIGSVAGFLASSDASYITGETIVVGGGIQSRL